MALMISTFNRGVSITKSDTVNFDGSISTTGAGVTPCDSIFVGTAGVVVVVFQDGSAVPFTCIAGQVLPVQAIRVNSSNTVPTLMVALYQN